MSPERRACGPGVQGPPRPRTSVAFDLRQEPGRENRTPGSSPADARQNGAGTEWETRFETNSYGFRPGRCTMDAIVALHATLASAGASEWVLDGDISGCFDNIGHEPLLARLPVFTTMIQR